MALLAVEALANPRGGVAQCGIARRGQAFKLGFERGHGIQRRMPGWCPDLPGFSQTVRGQPREASADVQYFVIAECPGTQLVEPGCVEARLQLAGIDLLGAGRLIEHTLQRVGPNRPGLLEGGQRAPTCLQGIVQQITERQGGAIVVLAEQRADAQPQFVRCAPMLRHPLEG